LEPGRQAYLVGALGRFKVNDVEARARDGVVVRDAEAVIVEALAGGEILLADLPGGRG
jgi:redox-sensitive bicupin YhaK (pirin superfamily)